MVGQTAVSLDQFLQRGCADVHDVVAAVGATVHLASDDVLLAVGSLVEGLGTSKSDLDLWLITSRNAADIPPRDHFPVVVKKCLVDVQILRRCELEDLVSRLAQWSRHRWDVTLATKFS